MRLFCIFFANDFNYLNLRVQWDTPHVNKNLDVYPAGFHLKFIDNYDCHRKNVNK